MNLRKLNFQIMSGFTLGFIGRGPIPEDADTYQRVQAALTRATTMKPLSAPVATKSKRAVVLKKAKRTVAMKVAKRAKKVK
ncbi:hypothetical protein EGT07_18275 [Herbaspirillum sp. HC18]|nr:hypothetical protein EGT07_18275 [Herbaspirillum sp. HC18]